MEPELDEDEIITVMVKWFFDHYEDPCENMPWDDGYVWLCDPHDAREVLETEFPKVPRHRVDRAVLLIEDNGSEWVSIAELAKLHED